MSSAALPAIWMCTSIVLAMAWDALALVVGAALAGAADIMLRVTDANDRDRDQSACQRHGQSGCDCDSDPVVW